MAKNKYSNPGHTPNASSDEGDDASEPKKGSKPTPPTPKKAPAPPKGRRSQAQKPDTY